MSCPFVVKDGSGWYCKLKPMDGKDYPHKYWRTDCLGERKNIGCIMKSEQPKEEQK